VISPFANLFFRISRGDSSFSLFMKYRKTNTPMVIIAPQKIKKEKKL